MPNDPLKDLDIGLIKFVKEWLNNFDIPYKEENIKRFTRNDGTTKSFRILVNKNEMLQDSKYEGLMTHFKKSGKIYITLNF